MDAKPVGNHPKEGLAENQTAGCAPDSGAPRGVMRDAAGRFLRGSAAPPGVGAPPGHLNSLTTGTELPKRRLVLGTMPSRFAQAERNARKYRRLLETAVIGERGEVSVVDAHLISQATSNELYVGVLQQLLRSRVDVLKPESICRITESIGRAIDSRNRAVRQLNLEQPETQDPVLAARARVLSAAEIEHYDRLYGEPQEPPGRAHGDGTAQQTTQTQEDQP